MAVLKAGKRLKSIPATVKKAPEMVAKGTYTGQRSTMTANPQ